MASAHMAAVHWHFGSVFMPNPTVFSTIIQTRWRHHLDRCRWCPAKRRRRLAVSEMERKKANFSRHQHTTRCVRFDLICNAKASQRKYTKKEDEISGECLFMYRKCSDFFYFHISFCSIYSASTGDGRRASEFFCRFCVTHTNTYNVSSPIL